MHFFPKEPSPSAAFGEARLFVQPTRALSCVPFVFLVFLQISGRDAGVVVQGVLLRRQLCKGAESGLNLPLFHKVPVQDARCVSGAASSASPFCVCFYC